MSDRGISTAMMCDNLGQMGRVYHVAETLGVECSLTLVTDSPTYCGEDKSRLRRSGAAALVDRVEPVSRAEYRRWHPERWLRA